MKSDREKPWHKNAPNLLIVNSILAAISAIVIQTLAADPSPPPANFLWLILGVVALIIFIVTAEKITEIYSYDDVRSYVAYYAAYDIAVLLLFIDLFIIIEHRAGLPTPEGLIAAVVLIGGWLWGWGLDLVFLFRENDDGFAKYLDELEGASDPTEQRDWYVRGFFALRSRAMKRTK